MSVKLLTEHHFEFLSLKGGRTGSSESTLVKMPHCWKSHVTVQLFYKGFENNLSGPMKHMKAGFQSMPLNPTRNISLLQIDILLMY